jgi:DNA replication and repair protein RecF
VSLLELVIDDLRCIERAELELHPGHNLIWGGNGSGKTSLLEAIFLLGRGRSFRTRNSERLIRYGRDRLVVFGRTGASGGSVHGSADEGGYSSSASDSGSGLRDSYLPGGVRTEAGHPASSAVPAAGSLNGVLPAVQSADSLWTGRRTSGQPLGIQVSRADGTSARISGANAKSLTELTQVFPVQVIDPGIHKLVEEGAHRRRRWMDWAVFHVERQFGDGWLRYTRALKQRNAALRTHPAQASVWDSELARLGELIAAARARFVEALLPYWKESILALSGLEPELHYFKGWAQDTSLADALVASRTRDEARRNTHPGPHRADMIVRMNGRPAKEVLSRGQQKLIGVAMILAQLNLVQHTTQTTSTLLLDDPAAELDGDHLRRFIEQVLRLRSQLILTSLHPEFQLFGKPDRVFHVEQGRVQPVV